MKISLPYPPSVNSYWRMGNRHIHISDDGRQYRANVIVAVRMTRGVLRAGGECRLKVDVEVRPPDKRRRDLDNVGKALLDAMQHAGLYDDDSQIDDLRFWRAAPVSGGEVIVTIDAMAP